MDEITSQEATPSRGASTPSAASASAFDPRDLIPTPLFCASPEGRLVWMNAAAEQLTGRHAASVAGEPFSVMFPEEVRMKVARELLRRHRRGITEFYVEAPILTAGVDSHWVGLHVRLATAANGRRAYVAAVHDLHEIHADLEALSRRNLELSARLTEATAGAELKSSFLATMSSELRAPMNGVIGMSRLLLDSNLDRDQRTWTEVIQGSGQQLLELVDDILDYSRIESGQLTIGSMDFDLRVTVDAVASLLASRAHEAGIQFSSLVQHRVPSLLNGDPGRVRQILLHLGECALERASGGEVQLRVELVEETAHQAVLRFWVNRIGGSLGGDPETEAGLLSVYAGEGSDAPGLGGRALGLTIGRRIVTLMGGDSGGTQVPELGSRLWFRVPFGKQLERPVPVPAASGSGRADVNDIRALAVDGDAAARGVLREAIASWGGSCEEAEGGLEAIERLKTAAASGTPFGVALVDLDVAELDAEGFARAVRADGALAGLPLVLVTGLGRPGDAARAESWGYNGYFVKPVDAAELKPALAELLARDAASGGRLVTRHTVAEMKKRGIRVLVVEDNALDQLVIASALRRVGYTPEMVANVEEAAAAVSRQAPDIVFVDVAGVEEEGYERARGLRDACDGASGPGVRTPLVALVGRVREEEKARFTASGVDDLLGKPVDLELLVATVGRLVEARAEIAPEVADSSVPAMESGASEAMEPAAEWSSPAIADPVVEGGEEVPAGPNGWEPVGEPVGEEVAPEHEAEVGEPAAEPASDPAAESASDPAADPIAAMPVLDAESLESACMGNAEIRGLLVDAFLTRTRQPLDRLKKAAEWRDLRAVEFQAQAMRGMCASVGALRCAAALEQVVFHASSERMDEAVAAVTRVESELEGVRATWSASLADPAVGRDGSIAQAA